MRRNLLMKRGLSLLLIMVMFFVTVAASTVEVSAATKDIYMEVFEDYMWEQCDYSNGIMFRDADWKSLSDKVKVLSVVSSNPSVVKVEKRGSKAYETSLHSLKPGKSTITVRVKYKGKKYQFKKKLTVKPYPSPYKSIKVNDKALNIKKNKFSYTFKNYKKKNPMVQITPKEGWTITYASISKYNPKKFDETYKWARIKKPASVKKGLKLKLPKTYDGNLYVQMTSKKGYKIEYNLSFFR